MNKMWSIIISSLTVFEISYLFGISYLSAQDTNTTPARHSELIHNTPKFLAQKLLVQPKMSVKSHKKIVAGEHLNPIFSPDGKKIFFTGEQCQGLYRANLDGSNIEKITDEPQSGWRPNIINSDEIVYRTGTIDESGNIRYKFKSVDLKKNKTLTIGDYTNEDVYPPIVSKFGDQVYMIKNRKLESIKLKSVKGAPAINQQVTATAFSDEGRVWIHKFGWDKPKEISKGRDTCGGETLSPDGTKIAYLYLNNVIVYDLITDKEVDLGEGSVPAWSPDSKLLAYCVTCDDGHTTLHSDIFVANLDTGDKQRLTNTDDVAELNPSWSPDSKSLVCYDGLTGNVYLLEIQN